MAPTYSPWGEIDWTENLTPGIDMVATPRHGGIMVSREAVCQLSPEARKCGFWDGGYLCFEEDADENVVFRELLDKGLWQIPSRIKDTDQFVADINSNIRRFHPEYWQARTARLAKKASPPHRPRQEHGR